MIHNDRMVTLDCGPRYVHGLRGGDKLIPEWKNE